MKSKSSTTTKAARQVRDRAPNIHPGEFLAEILEELGLSQAEFARVIGVSPMRVSHVVNGARPVTAELALLFSRAFEQTSDYWLNLQRHFDLQAAEVELGARLDAVSSLVAKHKEKA